MAGTKFTDNEIKNKVVDVIEQYLIPLESLRKFPY